MGGYVRRMETRDIPVLLQLATAADWHLTASDLGWLRDLNPEGCLVAETKMGVSGFITSCFFENTAWWGNLLVNPACRKQGIATALTKNVLSRISGKSAATVCCTANGHLMGFYERFGFQERAQVVSWSGSGSPSLVEEGEGAEIAELSALNEEACSNLDASLWGFSRSLLLQYLLKKRKVIRAEINGRNGFLMIEPVGEYLFVGPWEIDPAEPGLAGLLLRRLFSSVPPNQPLFLKTFAGNYWLTNLLLALGFKPYQRDVILYCGVRPSWSINGICSLATGGAMG